ncbi:MAG: protein kinase [Cyanobacteria bacterium]|nr:protein kinase [Cyanobacteriota bacterium]
MADSPEKLWKTECDESQIRLRVSNTPDIPAESGTRAVSVAASIAASPELTVLATIESNEHVEVSDAQEALVLEESLFGNCTGRPKRSDASVLLDETVFPASIESVERSTSVLVVEPGVFPIDRYRPLSLLSKSVMKSTYLAIDRLLQTPVVVECFEPSVPVQSSSFEKSVKSARRLQNNNVLIVTEYGTTAMGQSYVVSDYRQEMSLAQYIEKNGALNVRIVIDVFLQVLDALAYLEEHSINIRNFGLQHILVSRRVDGGPNVRLDSLRLLEPQGYQDSSTEYTEQNLDINTLTIQSFGGAMYHALAGRSPIPYPENRVRSQGRPENAKYISLTEAHPGRAFRKETEDLVSGCLNGGFDSIENVRHALLSLSETITHSGDPVRSPLRAKVRMLDQIRPELSQPIGKRSKLAMIITLTYITMLYAGFAVLVRRASSPPPLQTSSSIISMDGLMALPLLLLMTRAEENPPKPAVLPDSSESIILVDRYLQVTNLKLTSANTKNLLKLAAFVPSHVVAEFVAPGTEVFDEDKWTYTTAHAEPKFVSKIRFSSCQIEPNALSQLSQFNQLDTIVFESCKGLTPETLHPLVKVITSDTRKLKKIIFDNCDISGETLKVLKPLSQLKLGLLDTRFSDKDFSSLCELNVSGLYLSASNVSKTAIEKLASVKSLKKLTLAPLSIPGDDALEIRSKLSRLRVDMGFDPDYGF